MTKSQEQRMNELANKYAHDKGVRYCIADERDFKAGYKAAMKEAEVLVEALEHYKDKTISGYRCRANRALKKFKGE